MKTKAYKIVVFWLVLSSLGVITTFGAPPLTVAIEQNSIPLFIEAKIGSQKIKLLVDSGTSWPLLDDKLQGLLGEKLAARTGNDSDGRPALMQEYQIDHWNLHFGAINMPSQVFVGDIDHLNEVSGWDISGLIPLSSLRRRFLEIDYDASKFSALDDIQGKQFTSRLPLQWKNNTPRIQMSVGNCSWEAIIDTGYLGSCAIPRKLFQKLADSKHVLLKKTASRVANMNSSALPINSGWFLKGHFMGKPLEGTLISSTDDSTGLIGLKWLAAFHLLFDTNPNEPLLYFSERTKPVVMAVYEQMLGAVLQFNAGKVFVARLRPWPVGPAQTAGLEPNDRILTFDGLEAAEINIDVLNDRLGKSAGREIQCTVAKQGGAAPPARITLKIGALVVEGNFPGRTDE